MEFSVLKDKTLTCIEGEAGEIKGSSMIFHTSDGERYELYHGQDCCESVFIEDITGDLSDLIGNPILQAEESTSYENPADASEEITLGQDSFTWTFYKLATIKGSVTIRWYGESNGYYSESVDFRKIPKGEQS